ncbi:unnamed protein product [Merluccius merluccius]
MKEALWGEVVVVVVGVRVVMVGVRVMVINSWHGRAGSQQAVLLWCSLWCSERAQRLTEPSNGNWQMVMAVTLRLISVETGEAETCQTCRLHIPR